MPNRTTREQAESALEALLLDFSSNDYFQKAEVASDDGGYSVDVWVDKKLWKDAHRDAKRDPKAAAFLIPATVEGVSICIMVVG